MEFIQIKNFEDFRVKNIYENYCNTFPELERRSEKQFRQLFKNENVKVLSLLNELKFIGYLIIWELQGFVFLEHFEVFESYRNQKFGEEILKELERDYFKIILETEKENFNENAKRRITFYLKNGFHQISDSYVQPSYGDGKTNLELLLFANWEVENLDLIIENIYDVVYRK
ncbi:GNAT family N-acetyltransferase [Halpernia sp.]|uniref:GNAT family N-acetyltransferase n=1 Tax=Halpernia sp. TaxID=2782209 RepID=UPI003A8E8600